MCVSLENMSSPSFSTCLVEKTATSEDWPPSSCHDSMVGLGFLQLGSWLQFPGLWALRNKTKKHWEWHSYFWPLFKCNNRESFTPLVKDRENFLHLKPLIPTIQPENLPTLATFKLGNLRQSDYNHWLPISRILFLNLLYSRLYISWHYICHSAS